MLGIYIDNFVKMVYNHALGGGEKRDMRGIDMGNIRVMVPQLMAENGMNISQLAVHLDVSWPTAQKLARGQMPWIRPGILVKLCEIFGVQPGEILIYRPDEGDQ